MTYTHLRNSSQPTLLVHSSWFSMMNSSHSTLQSFRRHEILRLQPDQIWRIETGFVLTTTWNPSGEMHTSGIWGSGDIVGLPLSKVDPYQVECLTPVTASRFPFEGQNWQTEILSHLQNVEALLGIVHQRSTATRLLNLLRWLAERFGDRSTEGWRIELNLTHQVLAELIGATRVTVTRQLNEFEQAGQLTRLRKHCYLLHQF
jgi:CRP-like cAMP-binding protein